MTAQKVINSQQKELADIEIREAQKAINYNTVGYSLKYFIGKISQQQINENINWDKSKQCYFIESLILGLPVLDIVFIDRNSYDIWSTSEDKNQLIDGKQRLYTALDFINGNLKLEKLKELTALNGFTFKDLPLSRQRKFQRISVRAIRCAKHSKSYELRRYSIC